MGILLNSISFIIFPIIIIIINQSVLYLPVLAAKSVLTPTDEIDSANNANSYLISAGGTFTLGFFTVDPSTNFVYLGIWYTNDDARKVWVANQGLPPPIPPHGIETNSFGSLTIDESGTLKVIITWEGTDTAYTTMFNVSDNAGSGNRNYIAVLEESGNFVLYDNAMKNRILWQSFDHPTDTLLPGMKVGYNLITGQNRTLTSWLSDLIPASGAFTMRLEQIQNSAQLVIYWRGKVYWSSGSLIMNNVLTGFLVPDASGMYFDIPSGNTNSGISMLQLSSMGELIDGSGNILTPKGGLCYGYHSYLNHSGCAISALPSCRGVSHGFEIKGVEWTNDRVSIVNDDSSNISMSDCMERCLNDCKCTGFSSSNSNETGCRIWGGYGENNLSEDVMMSTKVSVLLLGGVPKTKAIPKRKTKKTWKWILITVAILLTSTLTTYLCYAMIRRRRLEEKEKLRIDDYIRQLTGSTSFNNYGDELEKGIKDAPDVKIFSLKAILAATDNFSNNNKLGQGGYGPVFKGTLFDGRQIAVKRLSNTSRQGIEEFKNELILISKLQHTNLVRLYGCCIHQEEKMLIYEFMPKKSLDFFLFDQDKKETLDWRMRFNIIEGIAQGLLYLHKYSRMKVIHRDLKVSNVLLDENMNPKIADFGMARIFQQNMTEAVTNRVVGTYGYMAPEYAMRGNFSIKSDVFSFGVLILEIVSGKRNSSFYNHDRAINLVGYTWELWKEGTSLELKDESLGDFCDLKQLHGIIHVGLLCVQENTDDRPTMQDVICMFNNEFADLPNPKKPAFLMGTQLVEDKTKSSDYLLEKHIPVSENGLTITIMEAR